MKSCLKFCRNRIAALAGLALCAAPALAAPERIVSAGHSVTELVLALGAGEQLVAVDSSTLLPQGFRKLPVVGYYRQLPVEGLLAQRPQLLIGGEHMGPANTLNLLRSSGVEIVQLPEAQSGEQLLENIQRVAQALDQPAQEIAHKVARDVRARIERLREAAARLSAHGAPPRVLFVRAQSGRGLKVAGADTSPHSLIQLAGGENAVDFSGYREVSAEALLQLKPDWILYSSDQADQLREGAALLEWQPLLRLTPAGQARAFAEVDGHALLGGIGLASLGEARKLNQLFAGEARR